MAIERGEDGFACKGCGPPVISLSVLADRSGVGSTATLWRLVDARIDAVHLPRIQAARAHARACHEFCVSQR